MSRSPVFVPVSHRLTLEIIDEALLCHRNFSPQNQEPYQEIGAFPLQETEYKFSSEVFFTFFWISEKIFPTLGDGAGL